MVEIDCGERERWEWNKTLRPKQIQTAAECVIILCRFITTSNTSDVRPHIVIWYIIILITDNFLTGSEMIHGDQEFRKKCWQPNDQQEGSLTGENRGPGLVNIKIRSNLDEAYYYFQFGETECCSKFCSSPSKVSKFGVEEIDPQWPQTAEGIPAAG